MFFPDAICTYLQTIANIIRNNKAAICNERGLARLWAELPDETNSSSV